MENTLDNKIDEGLILTDRFRNTLSLDEETSNYALDVISKRMTRMSDKTKQQIYNQGIKIVFRGDVPLDTNYQNYVLFYPQNIERDPDRPIKLKAQCYFGKSDHRDVIDDEEDVIVAGTLTDNRFSSFTNTWLGKDRCETPKFKFGASVNELMLNHFQLD